MKISITQESAPIRLGFLILPDNETSFLQAINIALSTWGGLFAPIMPYYNELPLIFRQEFGVDISTKDFYTQTFANYDVDVIVIDNAINHSEVTSFAGDKIVVPINELMNETASGYYKYRLPIEKVAEYIFEKEFKFSRADGVRFCIPQIAESDLFLKVWRGTLPSEVEQTLKEIFVSYQSPILEWSNIANYINERKIDPRYLSYSNISFRRNRPIPRRKLLYCLDTRRLQDIINFWNLRAAGVHVMPLPVDRQGEEVLTDLFEKFYQQQISLLKSKEWVTIDCLLRTPASAKLLSMLQGMFHDRNKEAPIANFSIQQWFPRFWGNHDVAEADHIKSFKLICTNDFDFYEVIENRVELIATQLPFSMDHQHSGESTYKIKLEMSIDDEYGNYAGFLAGISQRQLQQLINDYGVSDGWNLSNGVLQRFVRTTKWDSKLRFTLPLALPFFTFYFQNKGYLLKETVNSKLAKEVFKNMGGQLGVFFFLDKKRLEIIELFEERRAINYKHLMAVINRLLENPKNGKYFIQQMLDNKIIEFGALLKCAVCEQSGYFLLDQMGTTLTCPSCRNSYKFPMTDPKEIEWAYRGIGPFSGNNKAGGIMSVFATMQLFQKHICDENKLTMLLGFELTKANQTVPKEIDLCLLAGNRHEASKQPDLIICECKTAINFKQIDIDRMKVMGDEFPGAILTVATLNESLTADEVILFRQLVHHFQTGDSERPRNPVFIVTGKELLNPDISFPLKEYNDMMHPSQRHGDYIGALCELSVKKHLGIPNWWDIKKIRWDEMIYRKQMIRNIIAALLNAKA